MPLRCLKKLYTTQGQTHPPRGPFLTRSLIPLGHALREAGANAPRDLFDCLLWVSAQSVTAR